MRYVLQKISAGLLLLAAAIPFVFLLSVQVKQQMIRHEMKENLEQQLLQTITLSADEVQWIKPGKEIMLNGKMFDIKIFSVENNLYKFTGLYDDDETELANQLENNFKKTDESGASQLTAFFHWLHSVYSTELNDRVLMNVKQELFFCFINVNTQLPFKTILTPPPQA